MNTGAVIAASTLLGVIVVLTAVMLILYRIRTRLELHIQAHFDKENIIAATTRANFFGKQSQGGRQIRGKGALVLTKNAICFIRAVPFKQYRIKLESVLKVSLPRSFNGKSVFARLLCVQYSTDSGTDAMGWALKNPELWKAAIEDLTMATS